MGDFVLFCIVVGGGFYILYCLCVWFVNISLYFEFVFVVGIFFILVGIVVYLVYSVMGSYG